MSVDLDAYKKSAELLKALAHPQRLCIVHGLMNKKCNVTKMQECLDISQSSLSQHLAKLRAAGIIEGTRCGNEVCYELVSPLAANIVKTIFQDGG